MLNAYVLTNARADGCRSIENGSLLLWHCMS